MKRMIDKLKDHYIICGYGRVGRGAAEELARAGVPLVVVDIDPDRVERAMIAGQLAVSADSTRDDTLRQVGIERARGLGGGARPATPTTSSCCFPRRV